MNIEIVGVVFGFLTILGAIITAWINLNNQVASNRSRIINLENQSAEMKSDIETKVSNREGDQLLKKIGDVEQKIDNLLTLMIKQKQ